LLFDFAHDRSGEDLTIDLIVFNSMGTKVYEGKMIEENSRSVISIDWDLRTNDGGSLRNGVYYYQIMVTSRRDGATESWTDRLIIQK